MGCFFFKTMTEKLKVRSPKKINKSKDTHSQFRVRRQRKARKSAYWRYDGPPLPNVVGLRAPEAVRLITQKCPGLRCEVIQPNNIQTKCYIAGRVKLIVNRYQKVVEAPHIG
ncbi:hypothetical protein EJB05_18429 [Eragrostis curvula]|uniref:Uncharacterized protein n=1 Tax=Eragrostis curvula TaxID=38414 RepID=A0A5J9VK01_9POAL|nr:hypothetical protein EJB05_18429 [Eragrostis curvula]